ncbi:MAG: T9SS type A sorting domain-containing protein [Bacteroidales bacterium]
MKKRSLMMAALTLCSAGAHLMAADGGPQLKNSTFEGEWEIVDSKKGWKEPAGWNSFPSMQGNFLTNFGKNGEQLIISDQVRPQSAGTQSALIKAKLTAGIIANGNMTSGRVNAGSTSPTNASNYNFTNTADENFSQPMTGRPDSISVWVKYTNTSEAHNARIAAIIHDSFNFKDPSSDEANNSHIVAKAELNYEATEWKRVSIPFDYASYEANAKDPHYMLLSFTTNMTPGVGSKTDEVYVDDILLVYKPELTIGQLSAESVEPCGTLTLPFTLTGTMSPYNVNAAANEVIAELSDVNGDFTTSVELAKQTTDESGTLTLNIPADLAEGNYKVRLRSTNYPMVTAETRDLTVKAAEGGLPPLPEMTPWETINTLPWTDQSLTTDWTGTDEPKGWNAMTVLLDDNLNPSFHYPSAWAFVPEENATFVSTENGPIHALMLPFLNVPEGVQKVKLTFDYLSSQYPMTLLVTEGEDKRMNAETFMNAVLGTEGKSYQINPSKPGDWSTCSQEIDMSDFASRGLNLVMMIFDASGTPAVYGVRNAQLEDAQLVSNEMTDEDKAVMFVKDGQLNITQIDGSAQVEVYALNGAKFISKVVTENASFNLNKGIYIVKVITGNHVQTEKIIVR